MVFRSGTIRRRQYKNTKRLVKRLNGDKVYVYNNTVSRLNIYITPATFNPTKSKLEGLAVTCDIPYVCCVGCVESDKCAETQRYAKKT